MITSGKATSLVNKPNAMKRAQKNSAKMARSNEFSVPTFKKL